MNGDSIQVARLEGKVAIVTGGSRGIGAAISKYLAREGAAVVVNYHASEGAAADVVRAIEANGGRAVAVRADVADETQVRTLFDEARRAFGKVDVVVNNAGIAPLGPIDAVTVDEIDRLLALNVRGVLLGAREAARSFDGAGGRIVNVSSVVAAGGENMAAYAATKAAVNAITRSLALELGSRGITVNAVAPGATDTEMFDNLRPNTEHIVSRTALGRLGQPDDIASVVTFLASDDAAWVTGQVIGADGGISL